MCGVNTVLFAGVKIIYKVIYIGLARTIYIRCVYGIFGREITIHTVIYGVYIRFWPTQTINHCYALIFLCNGQGRANINTGVKQELFDMISRGNTSMPIL